MEMAHDHPHSAHKNIRTAFFLNLGFTAFEIVGGIYTNSVAIVSDAIHDLGDSLSLGTAWYLQRKSGRSANDKFSFGYRRWSLLGALINSVVLICGSIYVIYEATNRIIAPEASDPIGMLIFAFIGVAVNGYAAWKMSSGKTLNERVITWHLLEDVLGWIAILIVAVVLQFTDNYYLDPALSLLITVYILYNVVKRLRETLTLFLQGHPKDVDRGELEKRLLGIQGVSSMHHIHIWSLDGEHHVFTAHFVIEPECSIKELIRIKKEIRKVADQYKFEHFTIELEFEEEQCSLNN